MCCFAFQKVSVSVFQSTTPQAIGAELSCGVACRECPSHSQLCWVGQSWPTPFPMNSTAFSLAWFREWWLSFLFVSFCQQHIVTTRKIASSPTVTFLECVSWRSPWFCSCYRYDKANGWMSALMPEALPSLTHNLHSPVAWNKSALRMCIQERLLQVIPTFSMLSNYRNICQPTLDMIVQTLTL